MTLTPKTIDNAPLGRRHGPRPGTPGYAWCLAGTIVAAIALFVVGGYVTLAYLVDPPMIATVVTLCAVAAWLAVEFRRRRAWHQAADVVTRLPAVHDARRDDEATAEERAA